MKALSAAQLIAYVTYEPTFPHKYLIVKRCPMNTLSVTAVTRVHSGQSQVDDGSPDTVSSVFHEQTLFFWFSAVHIEGFERNLRVRRKILYEDLAPMEIPVLWRTPMSIASKKRACFVTYLERDKLFRMGKGLRDLPEKTGSLSPSRF